ncbi:MAG: hypothetical protein V3R84_03980 [Acidimicrobiia bacterium]
MILAWRLGLGWLVGRNRILLTTANRRVVLQFRFFADTFYLRRVEAPWVDDLAATPTATVQAWPGPRPVRVRQIDDSEEAELVGRLWGDGGSVIALSPTGQRTPDMTAPDLMWVLPTALVILVAARRLTR